MANDEEIEKILRPLEYTPGSVQKALSLAGYTIVKLPDEDHSCLFCGNCNGWCMS